MDSNLRKHYYYHYNGNSPFLRRYVDSMNINGWNTWDDEELEEIDTVFEGYWEKKSSIPVGTTLQPSTIKVKTQEKTKKVEKKLGGKEKIVNFAKKIKQFFIGLFRKILMEEDFEDGYHREEH